MAKTKYADLSCTYPLKHKVVRDLKIVTEVAGVLTLCYTGYFDASASPVDIHDRYAVDLDFVMFNGVDIRPVMEVMGQLEDLEEFAIRHFSNAIESGRTVAA